MSTRSILILLAICFVLLGTQIVVSGARQSVRNKPVEVSKEATATAQVYATSSGQLAQVIRVVDGDTIEITGGIRVRYIGMDTPETVNPKMSVQCFGKEASDENKKLVEGKMVRLEKDISETDKYNRLLRYVYVGDIFVNDNLVRQGFAHAATFPPDVRFSQQLIEAEKEARENRRGLWGGCPSQDVISPDVISSQSDGQPDTSVRECSIKGNLSASGEKIYHIPGCGSYDKTAIDENAGERWFCTERDAVTAGWRKAKNCP